MDESRVLGMQVLVDEQGAVQQINQGDFWAEVAATLPQDLRYDELVSVETRYGHLPLIDAAIAPLVVALNAVPGVRTTSSCSGHEKLDATILLRAEDDDNDALMASPFLRALATGRDAQGEHANSRWVTRRLSGYPDAQARDDDFELQFRGRGVTPAEAVAQWYAERDAIIALCEQYSSRQSV